jgi:hypothetical protein
VLPEQRAFVLNTVLYAEGPRFFDDPRSEGELADAADGALARAEPGDRLLGVTKLEVLNVLRAEGARCGHAAEPVALAILRSYGA